jgi:malonyl-CoA O-methyltransferase
MTRFGSRKQEIAARFSQAAPAYAGHADLQAAIADTLLQGADWQGSVLDAGCGRGRESLRLAQMPAVTEVIALDIAPAMLAALPAAEKIRPLQGDMEAVPLPSASVAAVFSNFAMQWCESREAVCAEMARVLRPGGELRFSVPGPHSLAALRASGLLHVNAFAEAGQWQSALQSAGFVDVGLNRQPFTAWFVEARDLLAALKGIGANTADRPRENHLLGRRWWQQVTAALEAQREPAGLPLQYDVLLLRARVPEVMS